MSHGQQNPCIEYIREINKFSEWALWLFMHSVTTCMREIMHDILYSLLVWVCKCTPSSYIHVSTYLHLLVLETQADMLPDCPIFFLHSGQIEIRMEQYGLEHTSRHGIDTCI